MFMIITSWYVLPGDFLGIALVWEGPEAFLGTLLSPFSGCQLVSNLFWDGQAFQTPFWEFLGLLFPSLGFQPPKYCSVEV